MFKQRVKGVEFSRLLRQGTGPSYVAPPTNTPAVSRTLQFKPMESFLESRKKVMPWYTVSSTSVSAEDAESINEYINSGDGFTDVATPLIYIKHLLDVETLKLYMPS